MLELGRPASIPAACASLRGSHLPLGPMPPRITTFPTMPRSPSPRLWSPIISSAGAAIGGAACVDATAIVGVGMALVATETEAGAMLLSAASAMRGALTAARGAAWPARVVGTSVRACAACDCSIAETKRMRWYGCGATVRSAAGAGPTLATAAVGASCLLHAVSATASERLSLYPATGPVVSASGGQISTSRDTLQAGIRAFWDNVGRNMQNPKWTWGAMHVDVLALDAAVLSTTYQVAHLTPRGEPHVIAGAWTAVFQQRDGKWVIVQEHLSDVPAVVSAAQHQ